MMREDDNILATGTIRENIEGVICSREYASPQMDAQLYSITVAEPASRGPLEGSSIALGLSPFPSPPYCGKTTSQFSTPAAKEITSQHDYGDFVVPTDVTTFCSIGITWSAQEYDPGETLRTLGSISQLRHLS
jgi:hypothetical protein